MNYVLVAIMFVAALPLLSFGQAETSSEYAFKSIDEEVAMEVERGRGEVLLHVMVKDIEQYDHIIIERSAESGSYYGKCKYISCAEAKTNNGYMLQKDKYPFAANKDVFYRIKTVTKDGIERVYPAVLLLAATTPAPAPAPTPASTPTTTAAAPDNQ